MKNLKTKISSLVGIFLLGTFFFSCSQKKDFLETTTTEHQVSELEQLLSEVQEITATQINTNGYTTRAPWWKWLIFGVADAGGYLLTGQIQVGISASSLAWNVMKEETKSKNSNSQKTEEDVTAREDDEQRSYSIISSEEQGVDFDEESPAYMHNYAIERAYDSNGREALFALPEEEMVKALCDEVDLIYVEEGQAVSTDAKDVYLEAKRITDRFDPNMSIQEYTTSLKELCDNENSKISLDIISSVLQGLERSETGEEEYIGSVINAINKTSLDTNTKVNLKESVNVAYASSVLWNVKSLREAESRPEAQP